MLIGTGLKLMQRQKLHYIYHQGGLMSRGLGKIEKEVLRACVCCLFKKDEIKEGTENAFIYASGIRFIENGEYFRGISMGREQRRTRIEDEKIIDLKEVHHVYREKFGEYSQKPLFDFIEMPIEKQQEFFNMLSGLGITTNKKILSNSQEASYQRAVKSLFRKEYLKKPDYWPYRFVVINEKKIKPIRPKRWGGKHNT
jgi:hypothetical protein